MNKGLGLRPGGLWLACPKSLVVFSATELATLRTQPWRNGSSSWVFPFPLNR